MVSLDFMDGFDTEVYFVILLKESDLCQILKAIYTITQLPA